MEKLRILQLTLFVSFFSMGYLALNYLVFTSLAIFLGGINNYIYFFIGIFSVSFPVSMIIEQKSSSVLSRLFYMFSTTWMGITLYFLWAIIIIRIIQILIPIPLEMAGLVIIVLVSIISAYSLINAHNIFEKKVTIPLKNLKHPLKLVQLSDVHIGSVRNSGFLKRVVSKIEEINPDAVLITGDLADGSSTIYENSFYPFKKLKMPIFFTSGNHDGYSGIENVSKALKNASIHVLNNEMVEFKDIQIIGVSYSMKNENLKNALVDIKFDQKKPSVLMYHLPSEWDVARKNGINIQLSGHTHHGQFYPFNLIVKLIFPYLGGLYQKENDYLYVSPGTGTWGPPMRLGSRNEITLIELNTAY
ncbi:MAG: metallophosphoesterase [Methanobacteriaceae archaeon]|nr:metallophosphoesterase [Methanobacteriaceae archaeon]